MATTLTFRIFKGSTLIREEKLTQPVIKLGKVASAHLRIEDESVSRMHAIVEVTNTDVHLIDLGSTRGTFVNGQRINKAKLSTGDVITVGDARIELAIERVAATIVPPPVPMQAKTIVAPPPAMPAAPIMPLAQMPTKLVIADDYQDGARAVEVAAMLGDSVIDVKHCMDPKGGKVSSTTWGYFAAGVVALLSSAAAFATSVHNVAVNKAGLSTWVNELHRPAHAFRPTAISAAYDWLAFGGFAVALAAVAMGLLRMRKEKRTPSYAIGTAPGVELALEQAPSERFELVSPRGDDFVFNMAPGMEAELTVGGTSTPLSVGAIEIPANAKIRAKLGQTTFLVSSVAAPRAQAVPLFSTDSRILKYAAGSLALHMGIWAFLQTVQQDGSGTNIDLATNEDVGIRATVTDHELAPEKQIDVTGDNDNDKSVTGAGAMAVGPQGTAGDPKLATTGGTQVKNNNADQIQLTREQQIDAVRSAGWMGSTTVHEGIASLTGTADFENGFDSASFYGPEFGAEGNGQGTFGMGRTGNSYGGGCMTGACSGTIGSGRYGTIGNGTHAGDGWGAHGGHGDLRQYHAGVPPVTVGTPIGTDGLDKAIIKRYVKRQAEKIGYCYEKQLLAHPGLAGELMVTFVIQGDGSVKGASGKGFDNSVAGCVSEVVANISFPKPSDGGVVQVNYPFTFHATGA